MLLTLQGLGNFKSTLINILLNYCYYYHFLKNKFHLKLFKVAKQKQKIVTETYYLFILILTSTYSSH